MLAGAMSVSPGALPSPPRSSPRHPFLYEV